MKKPQIHFLETFLSVVRESTGSRMFQHVYATVDGKKVDILEGGNLSCAFYVSSILSMFGLINSQHATVAGLTKDLEQTGWENIQEPRVGAVLVWASQAQSDNSEHAHVGFYIGKDIAVSNSWKRKTPSEHDYTFDGTRAIEAIYWHARLEQ